MLIDILPAAVPGSAWGYRMPLIRQEQADAPHSVMSKLDRRRIRARDTRAMTRGRVSFVFVPQMLERVIAELAPQQRERVKLRAEELVALHRKIGAGSLVWWKGA